MTSSSPTSLIELSLNEVESLAVKAGRGAGMAWGLAEDVGYSARWLAEHGLPWASSLLNLLDAENSTRGPLSPVLLGAWLADSAASNIDRPARALEAVRRPLWLVPPLARASSVLGCYCSITGARRVIVLGPNKSIEGVDALRELATASELDIVVAFSAAHTAMQPAAKASRTRVSPLAWDALEALALKTYVPASSQSRATGAGAGLQDND
jgi:hypothetical protein